MNTCVADDANIVNIQGIRYVTWGEATSQYERGLSQPWYVTVTYKGNHQTFKYRTEDQARAFFRMIRDAMTAKKNG